MMIRGKEDSQARSPSQEPYPCSGVGVRSVCLVSVSWTLHLASWLPGCRSGLVCVPRGRMIRLYRRFAWLPPSPFLRRVVAPEHPDSRVDQGLVSSSLVVLQRASQVMGVAEGDSWLALHPEGSLEQWRSN